MLVRRVENLKVFNGRVNITTQSYGKGKKKFFVTSSLFDVFSYV